MSAVDEVRVAIDKLTGLKDDTVSVEHGWLVQSVNVCTCAGGGAEVGGAHEPHCGMEPLTNDPLTITLYATIDAQLALLEAALRQLLAGHIINGRDLAPVAFADHITLARAINGEDQS